MTSDLAAPKDIAPPVIVHACNVQSPAGSCLQRTIVRDFALPFEVIAAEVCCTGDRVGNFACNQRQKVTHRSLRLHTLAQVARECRDIDHALAAGALGTIKQKYRNRSMGQGSTLFGAGFGNGADQCAPGNYPKLQVALRQDSRGIEKQQP